MRDFTFGQGPDEPLRHHEIVRLGQAVKEHPGPLTDEKIAKLCLFVGINPLRIQASQAPARRMTR